MESIDPKVDDCNTQNGTFEWRPPKNWSQEGRAFSATQIHHNFLKKKNLQKAEVVLEMFNFFSPFNQMDSGQNGSLNWSKSMT